MSSFRVVVAFVAVAGCASADSVDHSNGSTPPPAIGVAIESVTPDSIGFTVRVAVSDSSPMGAVVDACPDILRRKVVGAWVGVMGPDGDACPDTRALVAARTSAEIVFPGRALAAGDSIQVTTRDWPEGCPEPYCEGPAKSSQIIVVVPKGLQLGP